MDQNPVQNFFVTIEGMEDSDEEEVEALTLELRNQLLEIDTEQVILGRHGETPQGAKVGESIAVGTLVVSMGGVALKGFFNLLKGWIENRPVRTVKVVIGEDTIELQASSKSDQRRLVEAFIERHGAPRESSTITAGHAQPSSRADEEA